MDSLKFNIDERKSLYFNKFKYKAQCHVPGIRYTHYIDTIDEFREKINRIKNRASQGFSYLGIENIDFSKIEKYLQIKFTKSKLKTYMIRMQSDSISVFANDKIELEPFINIDKDIVFFEAIVNNSKTMYFKVQPKYKYRTFFKGKKYDDSFPENINDLQNIYKDKIKFSKGLLRHLNKRSYYKFLHTSFYVDYNDESMIIILSLWMKDYLGKTYSLSKQE